MARHAMTGQDRLDLTGVINGEPSAATPTMAIWRAMPAPERPRPTTRLFVRALRPFEESLAMYRKESARPRPNAAAFGRTASKCQLSSPYRKTAGPTPAESSRRPIRQAYRSCRINDSAERKSKNIDEVVCHPRATRHRRSPGHNGDYFRASIDRTGAMANEPRISTG